MRPLLITVLGLALLLTSHYYINHTAAPVRLIAADMLGEVWYRISMTGTHVGYMRTSAEQDHEGKRHFRSTTHFLLPNGRPSTITKHLTFAARPDYPLVEARFRSRDANVWLRKNSSGYLADVVTSGTTRQLQLDTAYSMEDFLGFEIWLQEQTPSAGATQAVRSLDFERLTVAKRTYDVVEQNAQGYLVRTNAPLAATRTQLDHRYQPVHMNMSGLFQIERTRKEEAVPSQRIEQKPTFQFDLDQRLRTHTQLSALTLRLSPELPEVLPESIELKRPTVQGHPDPHSFLQEEPRLPINHTEIRKLAMQSGEVRSPDFLRRLVGTINQQLSYAEGSPAPDVLTALNRGYGECTDFADLLSSVARSAGIPARTVYGLAYADAAQPKLMFHAWNEVYWQGDWHAVDPTWGQDQVDATHLPLTPTQAALLMHAHNVEPRHFQVVDFEVAN